MKVYVINLKRRPDRRSAMEAQLRSLGVEPEFLEAVDAQSVEFDHLLFSSGLAHTGPWGDMSHGTLACTLSHLKTLELIAQGSEPFAWVLEDDAILGKDFYQFTNDFHWIPEHVHFVHAEHWNSPTQVLVVDKQSFTCHSRHLSRLRSRTAGAAGYVISKEMASFVLAHQKRINIPIDHLFLNLGVSFLPSHYAVWQMIPGLITQDPQLGSNIRPQHAKHPDKLQRKSHSRGFYELKQGLMGLFFVLIGKSKILRNSFRT